MRKKERRKNPLSFSDLRICWTSFAPFQRSSAMKPTINVKMTTPILVGPDNQHSSDVGLQRFLERISVLASGSSPSDLEEDVLARSLFNWSGEFIVSRAPGRLDVMGGIADYSGSLVLQMPIAEAAHVALQHLGDAAKGVPSQPKVAKVEVPLLQVVSFGASKGIRSPSFAMPLAELYTGPGGSPTPLSKLRSRFSADAGIAWAAYPVGVIAVLLHEAQSDVALRQKLGVVFDPKLSRGLSLLIGSDVPEGKGVSSSAAVEVQPLLDNKRGLCQSCVAGGGRLICACPFALLTMHAGE